MIDGIRAVLDAQSVVLLAEEAWGQVVGELLADLDRIHRQRARPATQIEEAFLSYRFGEVRVAVCGFGPGTGARTLAEIGNSTRQPPA
ncbi:hypothetical protein [Ilumatobacter sp.]|jgi:hypothetical protein|uniref:hypothetical protein n=1 Tax=Ilumatobacter sp. TaxID=1967498 RepID=UPI00375196C0